jgi:hypothetical protein
MLALVYISISSWEFVGNELNQLEEQARSNNRRHKVTGYMYFNGTHFVQYLEGPEAEVEKLYQRIQQDNRHRILAETTQFISKRRFPQWSMKKFEPHNLKVIKIEDVIINILKEFEVQNQILSPDLEEELWLMINWLAEHQLRLN